MVMKLCERLDVPLQARNQLLTSAGLSPQYETRPLDDAHMQPVRQALDWMLERHLPYPGFALDRHWRIVKLNAVATMLFGAAGLGAGDSLLDALIDNQAMIDSIENIDEVRHHMLARLATEAAHFGQDPVLNSARERLLQCFGDQSRSGAEAPPVEAAGQSSPVVATIYRAGRMHLSLFSTISHFGTAEDIALSELRVELLFPADDASRSALEAMMAASVTERS